MRKVDMWRSMTNRADRTLWQHEQPLIKKTTTELPIILFSLGVFLLRARNPKSLPTGKKP
jgi:hypothetical protein